MKAVLINILLGMTLAQPFYPYQQRSLYYSQLENVCHCAQFCDQIDLNINFSDRPQRSVKMDGGTDCDPWAILFINKLRPQSAMCFVECPQYRRCNSICFHQDTTYHRLRDTIALVEQNATVINPVKFENVSYNCAIEGDGTMQHFGPWNNYPTPRIQVYCSKIGEFKS